MIRLETRNILLLTLVLLQIWVLFLTPSKCRIMKYCIAKCRIRLNKNKIWPSILYLNVIFNSFYLRLGAINFCRKKIAQLLNVGFENDYDYPNFKYYKIIVSHPQTVTNIRANNFTMSLINNLNNMGPKHLSLKNT